MTKALILCDLDGVLADNQHRMHLVQGDKKDYDSFYGYDNVIKDGVIEDGINFVRRLVFGSDEPSVVIVTGRNEKCCRATDEWLIKNEIGAGICSPIEILAMRREHDYRNSGTVKAELIRDVLKYYDPNMDIYFIDDDPKNVKAVTEAFPFITGITFGAGRL